MLVGSPVKMTNIRVLSEILEGELHSQFLSRQNSNLDSISIVSDIASENLKLQNYRDI